MNYVTYLIFLQHFLLKRNSLLYSAVINDILVTKLFFSISLKISPQQLNSIEPRGVTNIVGVTVPELRACRPDFQADEGALKPRLLGQTLAAKSNTGEHEQNRLADKACRGVVGITI